MYLCLFTAGGRCIFHTYYFATYCYLCVCFVHIRRFIVYAPLLLQKHKHRLYEACLSKGLFVLVFWFHSLPEHSRADWVPPICAFSTGLPFVWESKLLYYYDVCHKWDMQKAKMCMYEEVTGLIFLMSNFALIYNHTKLISKLR